MDSEQLRMILDALTSMGEGGKEAFIYWLLMTEVVPAVVWVFAVSAIAWTLVTVFRIARELSDKADRDRNVEYYALAQFEMLNEHVNKYSSRCGRADIARICSIVEPMLEKRAKDRKP